MPDLILPITVAVGLAVVGLTRAVRARLAATDTAAVAEGWTVRRLRFGGRVYRDPRLDQLAALRSTSADGRSVHAGREAG